MALPSPFVVPRALVLLVASSCSAPPRWIGEGPADPPDSAATASATATATATGIAWDGDLARYDGCVAGDPAAKLLAQTVPPGPVAAGARVDAEIVLANCEATTWRAARATDAAQGVKLANLADTRTGTWGRARVLLPTDVPPGHAVRIRHDAVAPPVNGDYPWRWQLVDEWVRWIGMPTPDATVTVTGGLGPFTVHPRSDWEEASLPVEGPAMDLRQLEYVTVHYNGTDEDLDGDDDVYTDDDTVESLRNTQSYYVRQRGYSTGYNSEIAPDGDEWEIRGHDITNAANGCSDVNRAGYAIQVAYQDYRRLSIHLAHLGSEPF